MDHEGAARARRAIGGRRWLLVAVVAAALGPPRESLGEGFMRRVLRILGVTASPGQMKGDDDEPEGQGRIWLAELSKGSRKPLTAEGGYRWPVLAFDGKAVLALQGAELVTIAVPSGSVLGRRPAPGVEKLVGVDLESHDQLLVLRDHKTAPAALWSLKTGKPTALPLDPREKGEQAMLSHLRGEERVYGDVRLFVDTESAPALEGTRHWQEVYRQREGAPRTAVSACKVASCRQPSLSADGKLAVYVRIEGEAL